MFYILVIAHILTGRMAITGTSRISVGCRVIGSHGPLIENPNPNAKRRIRQPVTGTVICASGPHVWDVQFDHDGVVKAGISSRSLKIVQEGSGIPLNEISTERVSTERAEASIAPSAAIISSASTAASATATSTASDMSVATVRTDSSIARVSISAVDAAADDAIEEDEDNLGAVLAGGGGGGSEDVDHPNNDFCFTEEDFIESRTAMNDATRHWGTYNVTWQTIQRLKGEVVEMTNAKDGKCKWTVIDNIEEDYFDEIRPNEEEIYKSKEFCPIIGTGDKFTEDDYHKSFWFIWPETIDTDLKRLNTAIEKDNLKRKEEYKRTVKKVTKKEFIIFHALMIAASSFSCQGDKLWIKDKMGNKKKKKGFSQSVDFGVYMMHWRFRQIQKMIPIVMECHELSDEDDWWKFKSRVIAFNQKRINTYHASHILVFDESMSAFCPR